MLLLMALFAFLAVCYVLLLTVNWVCFVMRGWKRIQNRKMIRGRRFNWVRKGHSTVYWEKAYWKREFDTILLSHLPTLLSCVTLNATHRLRLCRLPIFLPQYSKPLNIDQNIRPFLRNMPLFRSLMNRFSNTLSQCLHM
jgi:hypothetical protein